MAGNGAYKSKPPAVTEDPWSKRLTAKKKQQTASLDEVER